MKHLRRVLLYSIFALFIVACTQKSKQQSSQKEDRMEWFVDTKFGMFIHWGLYAIPAGEWKNFEPEHPYSEHIMRTAQIPVEEYEKLTKRFNPENFDAERWVRLAKSTGMKYIVITAKHHDGFAMYHSEVSDYNIVDATPYERDPIDELAKACRKYDMKLGFYYSHARDWHEPGASWNKYGNTWDFPKGTAEAFDRYLEEKALPQVRELLTNYGPVAIMWFDTPYKISKTQSKEFVDLVHKLQPNCLVNSRVGNGLGDYQSMGDNEVPATGMDSVFETPQTIGETWGYKRGTTEHKSARKLIRHLVDVVSKGGNYLLNVGPTAKGVISESQKEVLEVIGRWMDHHHESIYETTANPLGELSWGTCTAKSGKLYLHVFDWPENGRLNVPGLNKEINSAYSLTSPKKEEYGVVQNNEGALLTGLSSSPPNSYVSVIVLNVQ